MFELYYFLNFILEYLLYAILEVNYFQSYKNNLRQFDSIITLAYIGYKTI